jgi:hypothetical protein
MSRQVTSWDSYELDRERRDKLQRKMQKIDTLRALLEMWESRPDEVDHDYLLALRARLRSAENQLAAMSI